MCRARYNYIATTRIQWGSVVTCLLIDYTNKLRCRDVDFHSAVVSAGATRLSPAELTAVAIGKPLLPMVTGVCFDICELIMSLISESTRWWQNMAIVFIFGLMEASFLTLVVVWTIYALPASLREKTHGFAARALSPTS